MARDEKSKEGAAERDERTDHEEELQLNAELAKAFQELARGEQTAAALESRLDGIEGRIEQLLASVEENARQQEREMGQTDSTSDTKPSK